MRTLKEGHYVIYQGDPAIAIEPLHSRDLAIFKAFEDSFGKERLGLHLLKKNTDIQTDYENIRELVTLPKHLIAAGFTEKKDKGKPYYDFGEYTIAKMSVIDPVNRKVYLLGYRVFHSSKLPINLQNYSVDNTVDIEKLVDDFPSVENINDLFDFFDNVGIPVDKNAIAQL